MMKNVSHVKANIPEGKRIAVCVSGGWDSAVLWHIIYEECKKRGQSCRPYTVPKIDGAVKYANQVLRWSGYDTDTNVVGSIDSDNPSDYVKSGVSEILVEGYADVVYTAVTAYYDEMEPDQDRILTKGTPFETLVPQPFAEMTKDEVVQIAFDLGIAEEIMDITHSCTELDEGRCGYCPWCKEREWAFKQINKLDKGTN
jgi:7-cyano-7-deazaguanine synthase in queuosine biosynthesis